MPRLHVVRESTSVELESLGEVKETDHHPNMMSMASMYEEEKKADESLPKIGSINIKKALFVTS